MPLVKTRAIDDVPVLGLTLWSENYDDFQLKQIAEELNNEIKKVNGVSASRIIGGRSREVSVFLDKDKMAENKVDFLSISEKIQANNQQSNSGKITNNDTEFIVHTGNFLNTVEDVENLIVGVNNHQPVYLKQIAQIKDGPETPKEYVSFGYGKASPEKAAEFPSIYNAITISVGKQKGSDAMKISEVILDKVESLKKGARSKVKEKG